MSNPLQVSHNICAAKGEASICSTSRVVLTILSSMWSKDITGVLFNLQRTCICVWKAGAQKGPIEIPDIFCVVRLKERSSWLV
jgi:hypothetical protein